jgi:hypothetical protein
MVINLRQISKYDGKRISVGKLFKKIGFTPEVVEIKVENIGEGYVILRIIKLR